MELRELITDNCIEGREEDTPRRLIDKAHSSLGKKLVQNLRGSLSLDVIFNNKRRQCEIRLFDQTSELNICKDIIKVYSERGFEHIGGSSEKLIFEKNSYKGYVVVTQSYFPEYKLLMVTEDFSQFKP